MKAAVPLCRVALSTFAKAGQLDIRLCAMTRKKMRSKTKLRRKRIAKTNYCVFCTSDKNAITKDLNPKCGICAGSISASREALLLHHP
jgi:hypothetical protein